MIILLRKLRLWFKKFEWPPRRKLKIRSEYDVFLLDSLRHARIQWLKATKDYNTGVGSEVDLSIQVELTQRRYWYLYRIARLRHVHGRLDINRFK